MNFDLVARDIIGDVQSVPQTFSSWDSCMAKSYCKYPVIVGIVVGSLILLSVIFCLVQCLCCGVSCAKMLCCCCRGCGRGSRERRPEFKDDYRQMPPTPYSGYQPSPNPMTYQGPSTATFDTSKKINEDSLPAMPSWDTARTHRVEEISEPEHKPTEDLEMGRLGPQRTGYSQVPNDHVSPISPSYPQQSGYFNQPNHSHNADIGAQNMGRSNGYNDFAHTPLSPAPTYHTTVPAGDRFIPGATSSSPYQYHSQPAHAPSYAPSGAASTRYEQTDYHSTYHQPQAASPPSMALGRPPSFGGGIYNAYDSGYTSSQNQRPPSLLQIGRRAVPGSTREV